jgi:molecular chaperone HscB
MENYFDLFGIPVQLRIDPAAIRGRFFELSRQFHPDFYVNRSAEEQQTALEKTAQLNKAWKTYQQPDELIRYVLELNGYWTAGEKYELSPDFLMEMMDINEALMDAGERDQDRLNKQVSELQASIAAPVASMLSEVPFSPTEVKLSALKEYYYRRKYLQRIQDQLSGFASL